MQLQYSTSTVVPLLTRESRACSHAIQTASDWSARFSSLTSLHPFTSYCTSLPSYPLPPSFTSRPQTLCKVGKSFQIVQLFRVHLLPMPNSCSKRERKRDGRSRPIEYRSSYGDHWGMMPCHLPFTWTGLASSQLLSTVPRNSTLFFSSNEAKHSPALGQFSRAVPGAQEERTVWEDSAEFQNRAKAWAFAEPF
jgi:hypothetical protein